MIFLNSHHFNDIENLLANHTEIAFVNSLPHKSQIQLLHSIKTKSNYTRLLFSNLWSDTEIIADLCAWLGQLRSLTHLAFSKSASFSLANFGQLGAAIQTMTTLSYLELIDLDTDAEKITCLAKSISKSQLKTLKLSNCNITSSSVRWFLACENLTGLHITDTKIRDWTPCFAAENKTLQKLNLSGNIFLYECETVFWRWLKKSKLTHLYLNRIPLLNSKFAAGFFSAILGHPTLELLQLRDCSLQNIPSNYLRQMIKRNTTLHTLDLQKNKIGYEHWLQIIASLQSNYTLQKLELDPIYNYHESSSKLNQKQVLPRGPFVENESLTGYLTRLLCVNTDLQLAKSFWCVKKHRFHPSSTNQRIIYMFHFMTKAHLPVELIYYILSFWFGVQTPHCEYDE